MDNDTIDDQLKAYFNRHKIMVGDDGFTQRVMQQLPRKRTPYYIVYLFLFLGLILFTVLNGFGQVVITISDLTLTIPELDFTSIQSLSVIGVFLLVVFSVSVLGIDKEDNFLSL